ncbi:hypothetical protein AXG93_2787s1010 [Marchantia polymorpha subsp. ruderalis]|uniref:Uncharacterized protein n=1 Tax=Marchantia polymorpha subsp. ruderalis TaxID=1480154 RepID=A0A176VWK5_MARPO|nr:hypothetical protein AXG93_2787s1010 [Marchantia polymorpha subsp. ruderalis]
MSWNVLFTPTVDDPPKKCLNAVATLVSGFYLQWMFQVIERWSADDLIPVVETVDTWGLQCLVSVQHDVGWQTRWDCQRARPDVDISGFLKAARVFTYLVYETVTIIYVNLTVGRWPHGLPSHRFTGLADRGEEVVEPLTAVARPTMFLNGD